MFRPFTIRSTMYLSSEYVPRATVLIENAADISSGEVAKISYLLQYRYEGCNIRHPKPFRSHDGCHDLRPFDIVQ